MTDTIDVFTHSSIRILSDRGTIYVDPFRIRDEMHDADYVFVTHEHFDHFSPDDIAKIAKEDTVLIVPESMKEKVAKETGGKYTIVTAVPGTSVELDAFSFETIPAYNKLKPFHPRGAGWVGYVFDLGGERIYVAGDTDLTAEAGQVKCNVALVPIGGTYTMNARQAAELINIIRPEAAIPVHYGSVVGSGKDAETFAANVDPQIPVEIKMQY